MRQLQEKVSGRKCSQQPPPVEFAKMLEALCAGDVGTALHITGARQSMERMKVNRAPDEFGLVAELHHCPRELRTLLLELFNKVLRDGLLPDTWCTNLFTMIPKTSRASLPTEFRPIANIGLLYKAFTYLVVGRIEEKLEAAQPEEQHGFRAAHRIEEHLLTASPVLDKTLAVNIPTWIVSLDLSKAFDRIAWPPLWQAL